MTTEEHRGMEQIGQQQPTEPRATLFSAPSEQQQQSQKQADQQPNSAENGRLTPTDASHSSHVTDTIDQHHEQSKKHVIEGSDQSSTGCGEATVFAPKAVSALSVSSAFPSSSAAATAAAAAQAAVAVIAAPGGPITRSRSIMSSSSVKSTPLKKRMPGEEDAADEPEMSRNMGGDVVHLPPPAVMMMAPFSSPLNYQYASLMMRPDLMTDVMSFPFHSPAPSPFASNSAASTPASINGGNTADKKRKRDAAAASHRYPTRRSQQAKAAAAQHAAAAVVAAPATPAAGSYLVDPMLDDADEVMSTSSYYSYASDNSSPISTPLKKRLKIMNGGIVHGLPRGSLPGTPASITSTPSASNLLITPLSLDNATTHMMRRRKLALADSDSESDPASARGHAASFLTQRKRRKLASGAASSAAAASDLSDDDFAASSDHDEDELHSLQAGEDHDQDEDAVEEEIVMEDDEYVDHSSSSAASATVAAKIEPQQSHLKRGGGKSGGSKKSKSSTASAKQNGSSSSASAAVLAGSSSSTAASSAAKTTNIATTCHQCKQKNTDQKSFCSKCCNNTQTTIRGSFCASCLKNRYGQDLGETLQDAAWTCPICLNECNCSHCRRRMGCNPVSITTRESLKKGYASVWHMVKAENLGPAGSAASAVAAVTMTTTGEAAAAAAADPSS